MLKLVSVKLKMFANQLLPDTDIPACMAVGSATLTPAVARREDTGQLHPV